MVAFYAFWAALLHLSIYNIIGRKNDTKCPHISYVYRIFMACRYHFAAGLYGLAVGYLKRECFS